MIEKKTKEEAIAALKEYVKLPDPPKPGTEKEQLKKLKNANQVVAGFFVTVPANEVENEADGLLRSYVDKTENSDGSVNWAGVMRYDIARCIVDRAVNIATKGA